MRDEWMMIDDFITCALCVIGKGSFLVATLSMRAFMVTLPNLGVLIGYSFVVRFLRYV